MHDLERLITEWRKTAAPDVSAETLDELETHLRETAEELVRSGMSIPSAFQRAVANLGNLPKIVSEFRKLDEPLWLPVKLAIGASGATALVALVLAVFVIARLDSSRSSLLLAIHTFTVTLGYTLTLLIGSLGICFVSQRCLEDFSTSRLHSIGRVSFVLGSVALLLTTAGVLLGMVWAKIEWGRYWAWDTKEIGGLSVVVWQVCFLFVHRFAGGSPRSVLVMSVLGNIVVSLAWFGANLLSGLHNYGTPSYWPFLLTAVIVNFAFFGVGLAPAGWLQIRKE